MRFDAIFTGVTEQINKNPFVPAKGEIWPAEFYAVQRHKSCNSGQFSARQSKKCGQCSDKNYG